ncbi:hypothetical protein AB2J12_25145 (plasmid) [Escherichia coli]
MKIGITLCQPEAEFLKSMLSEHMKSTNHTEKTFLIDTNYDAGTIEFIDEDTADSLCVLPAHLFTPELRDSRSIEVNLEPSIELYSDTQYPRSFKALLNIFIADIVEIVKQTEGGHIVTAEYEQGTIKLTGDFGSMSFLDFVPKHFEDFLSSEVDDLDFILKFERTFKVNKK